MRVVRCLALLTFGVAVAGAAGACPVCVSEDGLQIRALLREGLWPDLAAVLAPVPALLALVGVLRVAPRGAGAGTLPRLVAGHAARRPVITAGAVLGIGLGGFVDGIVFHQILQLHNMLSAVYPPTSVVHLELNMVWDGVFHAFTWTATLAGVALLWRAAPAAQEPWAGRTLVGAGCIGWGGFNLVEGVIDHFVLGIHHVVERLGLSVWDWMFLASGALLVALGIVLVRGAPSRAAPQLRPVGRI